MSRDFRKILVANRGEIAVRIIRACRELGIETVAVYSEADRPALHVRQADEAYLVGPRPRARRYLRIERVLEAARKSGADAVHPGYGFLAENAAFARACEEARPRLHRAPQRDHRAHGREDLGPPRGRGGGRARGAGHARAPRRRRRPPQREAERIGFPVMLKAAAGGGGKGLRLVASAAELAPALARARSEAKSAFGDDRVYLEKAIAKPRHIEIQVLADAPRERRPPLRARVLDPAPAPEDHRGEPVALRDAGAARADGRRWRWRLVKRVGYVNAGTLEFLVDDERNP